jgi:hypothetical protein
VNSSSVALMRFAAEAGDEGGGSVTPKSNFFIHSALKMLFQTSIWISSPTPEPPNFPSSTVNRLTEEFKPAY